MQMQNDLAYFNMQMQNDFEHAVDSKWMRRAEALVGLDSMPGGKWCSTGNVGVEAVVLGGYIRVFVGKYWDVAYDPEKRRRCLDNVPRPLQKVTNAICW